MNNTFDSKINAAIMNFENDGQIPLLTEGAFEYDTIYDHVSKDFRLVPFDGKEEVYKARNRIYSLRPDMIFTGFVDRDLDGLLPSTSFPEIKITDYHDFFSEILLKNHELIRRLVASNSRKAHSKSTLPSGSLNIDKVVIDMKEIAIIVTLFEIYIKLQQHSIKLGEKMIQSIQQPDLSFATCLNYVKNNLSNRDPELDKLNTVDNLQRFISAKLPDFNIDNIDKYIGDHTLLSCLSKSLSINGIKSSTTSNQAVVSLIDCSHLVNFSSFKEIGEQISKQILRCTVA